MENAPYTTFLIYAVAVVAVAAAMLGLSALLGQRHAELATGQPYESGVISIGSARLRISIKFWLVAILFVIFDLEMVYVFAWAVALHEVGWPGYWGLLMFVAILAAALVYEWKMGALDWATNPERDRDRGHEQGGNRSPVRVGASRIETRTERLPARPVEEVGGAVRMRPGRDLR